MDIKLPDIKNFKKIEKSIGESLKKHTFLTWLFLGFSLLLFAGYIFYFVIYLALSNEPSPNIMLPTVKKSELNQIIDDLDEKAQRKSKLETQSYIDPFEMLLQ